MEKVAVFILLILFFCFPDRGEAQTLRIKAIEIHSVSLTAEDDLGDYSSFISKTRNPALFSSNIIQEVSQDASIANNAFSIDFIFNHPEKPFNEFIVGIQSASVTTDLFDDLSVQQDTVQSSLSLQNSSRFFNLKGGYQRVFRHDKRFSFILGSTLQLGIPVSANTTQTVDNTLIIGDESKFFAKQSISAALSFPLGLRLKAFRNISLGFMARPTLFYHRVDGTSSTTLLQGSNLSIQFNIRRK